MRGLWAALRFLTALPAPDPGPVPPRAAVPWYPLAGAAAGAVAALAAALAGLLWPDPVAAAAAVAATLWATGGLHLDGLIDVADGLGSRLPPERVRAVVRDSRVGAMGALAAALALLVRFSLVLALPGPWRWRALPAAGAAARAVLVWAAWGERGRPGGEGMGAAFAAGLDGGAVALAMTAGGVLAVGLAGPRGAFALAAAWLGAALAARLLRRRLGGLGGDGMGAVAEVGEWLALAVLAAHRPV